MFGTSFGTQISWLIPAALVAFVAGMWFTRRAPRTDQTRAGIMLWGGWMIVTAIVLSYMQGTVHPYYSVALIPGIAGLVAIAGRELWRGRDSQLARAVLSLMIAVTAIWSYYLHEPRRANFLPWLRWVVLIGGILGAAILAASVGRLKKYAVIGLLVGSIAAMGGSAAFTIDTLATAHTGSTPTAGPAVSGMGGFGGGGSAVGTRPDRSRFHRNSTHRNRSDRRHRNGRRHGNRRLRHRNGRHDGRDGANPAAPASAEDPPAVRRQTRLW